MERGAVMVSLQSSSAVANLVADHLDQRDDEVMGALITTGAFVSLADGQVETSERDELVNFLDGRQVVPGMSKREIGEEFDRRVRHLRSGDKIAMVVEALRPLAGLSLSSVVVRIAELVAAADGHIHPNELMAIKLIRLVMITLPTRKLPVSPVSLSP
jgi:tellurite resistance protein